MTISDLPLLGCDASVVTAYLQGDEQRLRHLDVIVAENGTKHQLVSVALTISEVGAGLRRNQTNFDRRWVDRVAAFWTAGIIRWIDVDRLIACKAEAMIHQAALRGWRLHPCDAIHLAASDHYGVKIFYTYREELKQFEVLLTNVTICEPIADAPLLL